MATPDKAYQAYYLRQHRVLGAYLALHCWHNGYDAVIVDRSTLTHMHELTKFTETHLSWLQRDIHPYFPESSKLYYTTSKKFAAVVLSRVKIPQGFAVEKLSDKERAKQWRAKDFRVAALSELGTCPEKFEEKFAAAFLALAGAGLCIPGRPTSKKLMRPSSPTTSLDFDSFMKQIFSDICSPKS